MLRASEVLERYTAEQIVDSSAGYDVEVRLQQGRIVFPADLGQAKRMLQFLNEQLYRGAITNNLYETNSKRPSD